MLVIWHLDLCRIAFVSNYTMCRAVNVKCKPSLNETVSEI